MMDGGSLGRHGSSCSSLDGVPFKIGPKFRPPPKVIYQPIIQSSCASRGPKDEYTFETEEAVLAWARAREEAVKKAALEQAERDAKAKAKDQQHHQGESAVNDAGASTCNPVEAPNQNATTHQQPKPRPRGPPRPPPPKPMSEPGAILKPTPIQHLNNNSHQNGINSVEKSSSSVVDVSMFESVVDPFDDLELQTLNDMEELKIVLDTSAPKEDQDESTKKGITDSKPTDSGASESFYELAAPISTSCWETFDDSVPNAQGDKALDKDNNSPKTSVRNSESPDIGDYVDIVGEEIHFRGVKVSGINPVSSLETYNSDQTNSHTPALSGNLPTKINTSSGIYKSVLPPIPSNHMKVANGDAQEDSLEESNIASVHNSISATAIATTNPFLNGNLDSSNSSVSNPKPVRIPPPPPVKPSRPVPTPKPRNSGLMWSSAGPSLADSLGNSPKAAEDQIVNVYSRHHLNKSNPDLTQDSNFDPSEITDMPIQPSSIPQLNRYRPLPPAPSPRPVVEKSQPIGLTDPYNSLSHEAQAFTDRVTSMGFLRAKVARAVEKFGQDEKEVLDHLFAVDLLVEKKYAPVHAEAALLSCKNDSEKAERFLKMQSQLEELGFSCDKVRDALTTSDLDHDKALDLLTA